MVHYVCKPDGEKVAISGTQKKLGSIYGRTDGTDGEFMPHLTLFGWRMCTCVMVVHDDDDTAADFSAESTYHQFFRWQTHSDTKHLTDQILLTLRFPCKQ